MRKTDKKVKNDKYDFVPVELKLVNAEVDLILRALELYNYNLEYMLSGSDVKDVNEREDKISLIKAVYQQVLAIQAKQVYGKQENITEKVANITSLTPVMLENSDKQDDTDIIKVG